MFLIALGPVLGAPSLPDDTCRAESEAACRNNAKHACNRLGICECGPRPERDNHNHKDREYELLDGEFGPQLMLTHRPAQAVPHPSKRRVSRWKQEYGCPWQS